MDLGDVKWGAFEQRCMAGDLAKAGLKTVKKNQQAKELDLLEQALEFALEKKGFSYIDLNDLVALIADATKSDDKASIEEHLLSYDSAMWLV